MARAGLAAAARHGSGGGHAEAGLDQRQRASPRTLWRDARGLRLIMHATVTIEPVASGRGRAQGGRCPPLGRVVRAAVTSVSRGRGPRTSSDRPICSSPRSRRDVRGVVEGAGDRRATPLGAAAGVPARDRGSVTRRAGSRPARRLAVADPRRRRAGGKSVEFGGRSPRPIDVLARVTPGRYRAVDGSRARSAPRVVVTGRPGPSEGPPHATPGSASSTSSAASITCSSCSRWCCSCGGRGGAGDDDHRVHRRAQHHARRAALGSSGSAGRRWRRRSR